MKNISIFQLIFLAVFFLFILGGLAAVAIYSRTSSNMGPVGKVTIWGPFDWYEMQKLMPIMQASAPGVKITYYQKNPDTLDYDLVESIASGVNPDLVILKQDTLIPSLFRLSPIPFNFYPTRQFQDSFIQEGELFLTNYGIAALPFSVDPLVMYWNRDIFSTAGIPQPPRGWDEIYSLAERLTQRDTSGTITQSGIALGEFSNIVHAKEIISALYLQTGDQLTRWKEKYNGVYVTWGSSGDSSAVMNFYTQFSNPSKPVYSWNRSLPDSKTMFISGRLAIYIGLASELSEIRSKSPNLNFDITYLPQASGGTSSTYADIYGISLLYAARNPQAAMNVAAALSSKAAVTQWVNNTNTPPVRRDVQVAAINQHQTIFTNSALFSRGWLDPNHNASTKVFKEMVESITSGADSPEGAVSRAQNNLKTYAP